MGGIYSDFLDLRKFSLQLAIDSADEHSTEHIVDRAEAYFSFLLTDHEG